MSGTRSAFATYTSVIPQQGDKYVATGPQAQVQPQKNDPLDCHGSCTLFDVELRGSRAIRV